MNLVDISLFSFSFRRDQKLNAIYTQRRNFQGMKIDNDLRLDFTTTTNERVLGRLTHSLSFVHGDDDEKHPLQRKNVKRMKFKMNITPSTARLCQPTFCEILMYIFF